MQRWTDRNPALVNAFLPFPLWKSDWPWVRMSIVSPSDG